MDELIITGKFMEMADVTRNTLIHYDNISLLKPVATNERGDRFYRPFQLYHIILIKLFQIAGMELKHIKAIFKDLENNTLMQDKDNKILFLKEQEKNVDAKIHNAIRAYRFTDKMVHCMNFVSMLDPFGPPIVRRMPFKGYFHYKVLDTPAYGGEKEYFDTLFSFLKENEKNSRDCVFPIVSHYGKSQFEEGDNLITGISYFTYANGGSSISKYTDEPVLLLRRIGSVYTIDDALDEIRKYLNRHPEYELRDNISMSHTFVPVGKGDEGITDRIFIAALKTRESEFKKIPFKPRREIISQPEKRLLSSGQFIKFTGITRNMLNLYEEKKLYEPQLVKENGYRMYGTFQIYQNFIVKLLQQAGYSLDECHKLMNVDMSDYRSYEKYIKQIVDQKNHVKDNLNKLIVSKKSMREIRRAFSILGDKKDNTYSIINYKQKHYYETITSSVNINLKEYRELSRRVFEKSLKDDRFMAFPFGSIVDIDTGWAGLYNMFTKEASDKIEQDGDNYILGEYAIVAHRIEVMGNINKFKEIRAQIEKNSPYKVKGRILNMLYDVRYVSDNNPIISMISLFPIVRV